MDEIKCFLLNLLQKATRCTKKSEKSIRQRPRHPGGAKGFTNQLIDQVREEHYHQADFSWFTHSKSYIMTHLALFSFSSILCVHRREMYGNSPVVNVSSVPFGSWQGSIKQVSFSTQCTCLVCLSCHLRAVRVKPKLPRESLHSVKTTAIS